MKKRNFLALFLAVVMMVPLVACGDSGGEQQQQQQQQQVSDAKDQGQDSLIIDEVVKTEYVADKITIVGNETAASLYPWGTDNSTTALFEIYETLFAIPYYGEEMVAMLADANQGEFGGYDHVAGTTEYTVYIHDNIYDHAGNHITASDVKFSYDTQVELEGSSVVPWSDLESVEVVDEFTIKFTFTREMTGIDDMTNFWPNCFIVSEKAFYDSLGNNSDKKSAFVTDACGTGPYKLKSYVSGSDIVVVKNEDYWQTDESLKLAQQYANVNEIVYSNISESAQQVLALTTGTVDYVNEVPESNLSSFTGDGYTIYSWSQYGTRTIAPNTSTESICNDINMRKAIFYAIDLDGLITAMNGTAERIYSLFGPTQVDTDPEWANWDNYYTKTDPELVKQYLDAAGYDGETIVFISGKKEKTAAEIILNMLTEAGITVELQVLDTTTFNNVVASPAEWDMLITRNSGWCGAVSASRSWMASKKYNGKTINGVDDPEWLGLMDTILTIEGHTKENIDKWQQMAIDNAYGMGAYALVSNVVFNDKINTIVRNNKNIPLPGAFTYNDPNA